jgi:hypothetical protein
MVEISQSTYFFGLNIMNLPMLIFQLISGG